MPAKITIEEKYKASEQELLEVRRYANELERKNKDYKKHLDNIKAKIKNLYYSLSENSSI